MDLSDRVSVKPAACKADVRVLANHLTLLQLPRCRSKFHSGSPEDGADGEGLTWVGSVGGGDWPGSVRGTGYREVH